LESEGLEIDMATNYKQPGDTLAFIAPSGGVTNGTPILIENVVVVPTATALEDAEFQGRIEGVFSGVLKASGAAWTTGQVLYFDSADATFKTSESATARRAGIAAAAAASDDTAGDVKLLNICAAVNVA
jgi:predicted RecA/RadA family phage recombinase